jgi:hypothetical protein
VLEFPAFSVAGTAETMDTEGAVVSFVTVAVVDPVFDDASVTQTRNVFAPSTRADERTAEVAVAGAPA